MTTPPAPTMDQLNAQLRQLQQNWSNRAPVNVGSFLGGSGMSASQNNYNQFQRQQTDIINQQMALQRGSADAAAAAEKKRVEDARAEMYGLARDRVGELRGDPMDQAIQQALMSRINGQDLPFNEQTKNAYFTDRAQQGAAAAQAQLARLHGNPNDPSYQAAMREIQDGQARSAQDARLSVDMQANQANYDARGQAINSAAPINQARNAGITDAQRYLGGLLSRETAVLPSANGGGYMPTSMSVGIPSFQSYQQATAPAGTAPRPAPAPGPAPAPRPAIGPTAATYSPEQQRMMGMGGYTPRPIPGVPMGTGSTTAKYPATGTGGTGTPIMQQPAQPNGGYVQLAGQPATRITNPPRWY